MLQSGLARDHREADIVKVDGSTLKSGLDKNRPQACLEGTRHNDRRKLEQNDARADCNRFQPSWGLAASGKFIGIVILANSIRFRIQPPQLF